MAAIELIAKHLRAAYANGANLEARANPDGTLSITIADTQAGGEITLTDGADGGIDQPCEAIFRGDEVHRRGVADFVRA